MAHSILADQSSPGRPLYDGESSADPSVSRRRGRGWRRAVEQPPSLDASLSGPQVLNSRRFRVRRDRVRPRRCDAAVARRRAINSPLAQPRVRFDSPRRHERGRSPPAGHGRALIHPRASTRPPTVVVADRSGLQTQLPWLAPVAAPARINGTQKRRTAHVPPLRLARRISA